MSILNYGLVIEFHILIKSILKSDQIHKIVTQAINEKFYIFTEKIIDTKVVL